MTVRVFRSRPNENDGAYYAEYEVPYCDRDSATVMDVLDYISVYLDHTLSYFKHSACNHGICGRCLVKANGKNVLACITRVTGEELLLEPAEGRAVVKDLVTE